MKIGILAFQQAINYGGTLQIYALQQTIHTLKNEIDEIYVINYNQPLISKGRKLYSYSRISIGKVIKSTLISPSKIIKIKKFDNFYKKYINLTELTNDISDLSYLDTMVVGSDQVWNPEIHDYDTNYLLKTNHEIKKISYAASVGKDSLNDKDIKYFEYLQEFSAISVREKTAKDLLSPLVSKDIQVTLDPTLLLSAEEWRKIAKYNKHEGKYILVYTMQKNPQVDLIAEKMSRKLNLPLKYLMPRNFNEMDKVSLKYTYSPEEFIGLFDDSEFVITNSFHGTCFSILFNKKFITVPHKTRGVRMVDLLQNLKLSNRIIFDADELEYNHSIIEEIDFNEANSILEKMKKESIEFLLNGLNIQ